MALHTFLMSILSRILGQSETSDNRVYWAFNSYVDNTSAQVDNIHTVLFCRLGPDTDDRLVAA